jgi:hypothetical protein
MSLTAPNHVSHPRVTVLAPTAFNVQSPHIPPPPPYRRVLSLLPRIRVMGHARRRREDEDRSELDRASEEELDGSTKRSSMRTEPRTVPEKRRRGRWPACVLPINGEAPSAPRWSSSPCCLCRPCTRPRPRPATRECLHRREQATLHILLPMRPDGHGHPDPASHCPLEGTDGAEAVGDESHQNGGSHHGLFLF